MVWKRIQVSYEIDECQECHYLIGENKEYHCDHPDTGRRVVGRRLPYHKIRAIVEGQETPIPPYKSFPEWCPLETIYE